MKTDLNKLNKESLEICVALFRAELDALADINQLSEEVIEICGRKWKAGQYKSCFEHTLYQFEKKLREAE